MDAKQRLLVKIHALEQTIHEFKKSTPVPTAKPSNPPKSAPNPRPIARTTPPVSPVTTKRSIATERFLDAMPFRDRERVSPSWAKLYDSLRELGNSPMAAPFRFNVWEMNDPRTLIGYDTVVKRPMEFETILRNIGNGFYATEEEAFADIDLIWSNCLAFNGPKHPLVEKIIPVLKESIAEIKKAQSKAAVVDIVEKRETLMKLIEELQVFDQDAISDLIDFLQKDVPEGLVYNDEGEVELELDDRLSDSQLQRIETFVRGKLSGKD
eukprot:CAMPEP_0201510186 /NCGR_PEP_ID=MMETSP0161_2-20130828/2988_1 /ASSEMBLY_ACC=CAM_ASM_000251 /TAXON_ID=180227 /ORGANISM="Neoparamoeba aestuarina, Strain SoJaBio B1-5/56/2" /LENGTH=266 /DNA_ID=CAMNT_0047905329 /DNA_START=27 /DNA_END=827 /DNA_ORIENTATION=-